MKRRDCLITLAAATAAVPSRAAAPPATCIAPAKPGGGFDLTCRLARDLLRLPVPQPAAEVEIRYVPGGIGALAYDRAVTQRLADPRQFIAFSTGSLLNLVQGKFGPHGPGDVRWLATLGTEYGAVAVRRESRLQSLASLREQLDRNPAGAVFGAGGGVGSQDWVKAALLVKACGSDHRAMRFVSFEGGGQAVAALKGGHVDVFCGDMLEVGDALPDGSIRLLAVLAPQRLRGRLAAVPTAREQGLDLVWPTVRGLYMGPGVGDREHAAWVQAFRRALESPQSARLLEAHGLQPHTLTGDDLQAYVAAEVKRLRAVAQGLGLRVS
jgi:putative tricarboxylic transport membrane protein